MPRDLRLNIHHECDITEWPVKIKDLIVWCEQHFQGGWNLVSESGSFACRGSGEHMVILLCDNHSDMVQFKLSWHP